MEQPINQTLPMEEESEKLHNAGAESNTAETNRSNQESISQINDNGSINLGKFKDAESLLKAYNSLQTEFTKKSQRLSELENSKTEFVREEKINEAIKELTQNHNIAEQFSNQIKEAVKDIDAQNYAQIVSEELLKNLERNYKSASDLINDQHFLQEYVYSNNNIRENIIRDYLTSLTNVTPTRVMSNISSSIPISPPNIPTTIQDAGKLAKNIIKKI
jgi:hypothetical protein